jgi:Leucine-rich repeat (LRR) protein
MRAATCHHALECAPRRFFISMINNYTFPVFRLVRLGLLTSVLMIFVSTASAQKSKAQKPVKKTVSEKPAAVKKTTSEKPSASEAMEGTEAEQQVKDIIAFFQYVLNSIGSSETPARDKDVLITESYSKIFRDAKVQVEDDLDEERLVITNKDIVAYLKDVDFFFKDVKFEFTIEDIKKSTLPGGEVFYKVSLRRNLTGTTPQGTAVNNTMPRFIEINYDPKGQDLKIVSIYTKGFDEKEALMNWWKDLSYEWKVIFTQKLNLGDSVQLSDIKNITAIEDLDLSGNEYIQTIAPLAQLINLKLLNLSETTISDLTPIRNLTELLELNLSNTKVQDLTPLKYASKLLRLNISETEVKDISVVEKMTGLQNLEIRRTPIVDFKPLTHVTGLIYLNAASTSLSDLFPVQDLIQLNELNISSTGVRNLAPVKGLKSLFVLNIDSTGVTDVSVLSDLKELRVLHANHTSISSLEPLKSLPQLERVYCDHTRITRLIADDFMASNKKVLVVVDSKDLKAWWELLPSGWQQIFSKTAGISSTPSKEELARVTNIDSVNFAGNRGITDLAPLEKLQKLKVVIASKTSVKDLAPLKQHRDIRYLDISETQVTDLSIATQFSKLKILRADRTGVETIEPLFGLPLLEKVYVDHTAVHDITAQEFLEKNPDCLLIYKTVHLNRWWSNLSEGWKEVFGKQMGNDTTAGRELLHGLVEKKTLHFNDARVSDLNVLGEFVRLTELHFSGTMIKGIPGLENLRMLKSLHATNSPLQGLEAVGQLRELVDLDISNTPVEDLKPIGSLQNLKTLNCSGTQIKKLDALERIEHVELLDCSNTRVAQLDAILHLPLKTLKCYNTKITSKEIEKFKEANPSCNVVYYR